MRPSNQAGEFDRYQIDFGDATLEREREMIKNHGRTIQNEPREHCEIIVKNVNIRW